MPELKIIYFDFPGRAEAARLALTLGDIPFEDERLFPEEYAEIRHTLPYHSLPVMTVDGAVYAQSVAILRYCGTLAGLYPADALTAQRVDEVIDVVVDFVAGLEAVAAERQRELEEAGEDETDDDSIYQVRLLKYINESVPKYLGGLEHRLKEFGDGPWAIGEAITIADLAIYVCLLNVSAGAFDHMNLGPMKAYKRIMASFEAVKSHPKVAAWNDEMAKRAEEVRHCELAYDDDDDGEDSQ